MKKCKESVPDGKSYRDKSSQSEAQFRESFEEEKTRIKCPETETRLAKSEMGEH